MEVFAFYLLLASSLAVFVSGLVDRIGYLKLPFLFSAVYLGWVIPQLWSIRQSPDYMQSSLTVLYVQCILCLAATVIGWHVGANPGRKRRSFGRVDASTEGAGLLPATIILTAFVLVMVLAIGSASAESQAASMWSGPLTILYFFTSLKSASLFMSLILFMRTRTKVSVALVALNLAIYFPAIFIWFRRRGMAEAVLAITFALWTCRRISVPRPLVIGGLIAGSFVLFAVGDLRSLAVTPEGNIIMPSANQVRSVDFLGSSPFAKQSAAPELRNALHLIHMSDTIGLHTYGGATWNRFVFQYVPGQLIGFDTKQGLMVDTGTAGSLREDNNYEVSAGSTDTGMGEAYVEFGFFGAIFFFATAVIVGRYWAWGKDDVWGQIFYVAALGPALVAPTAYASYFFVAFLEFYVILSALRLYARSRPNKLGFERRVRRSLVNASRSIR